MISTIKRKNVAEMMHRVEVFRCDSNVDRGRKHWCHFLKSRTKPLLTHILYRKRYHHWKAFQNIEIHDVNKSVSSMKLILVTFWIHSSPNVSKSTPKCFNVSSDYQIGTQMKSRVDWPAKRHAQLLIITFEDSVLKQSHASHISTHISILIVPYFSLSFR